MASDYKEVEDEIPYQSIECSEEGELLDHPDQDAQHGGDLSGGDDGEDAPQIHLDLETLNLPLQVPYPGDEGPVRPEPELATTPGNNTGYGGIAGHSGLVYGGPWLRWFSD